MKPIWVVLIALASLVLGFFLGTGFGGTVGGVGGAVVGSAFGACSVLEDAVKQQAIPRQQMESYYSRFASRVQQVVPGFSLEKELPLGKCEETLQKFREEAAKGKK